MILTSNYKIKGNDKNAVAISLYSPTWFKGEREIRLAPNPKLLYGYKKYSLSAQEYVVSFMSQLSKLDPKEIGDKMLGKIMLCWEAPVEFCHRHIVAAWLRSFGYQVEEFQIDRKESIQKCKHVVNELKFQSFIISKEQRSKFGYPDRILHDQIKEINQKIEVMTVLIRIFGVS